MLSRLSNMEARNLHASQSDYAGYAACTVAACKIGAALLAANAANERCDVLTLVDAELRTACQLWSEAGVNFLTPHQALKLFPPLSSVLVLREEHFCNARGAEFVEESSLTVPSVAAVLTQWDRGDGGRQPAETFCVAVRDGYSFLLAKHGVYYYCIDTHENALQRRRSAIVPNLRVQPTPGRETKGLLCKSLFLLDILKFVENYCAYQATPLPMANSSSNQIDIAVFGRRTQQAGSKTK